MTRPISASINLKALLHNHAVVRRCAPHSKIWSVVKANAYGHGDLRVVQALAEVTDGFALLEVASAIRLRESGIQHPILLLEGFFSADELASLAQYDLHTVIHSDAQLSMLERNSLLTGGVKGFIKLNTGMNRLGFVDIQMPAVMQRLQALGLADQFGLMTHFSEADAPRGQLGSVANQLGRFARMQTLWSALGGAESPVTLANSAAILAHPDTHADWVRPGIMLYGSSPFADRTAAELGLQPVMSLSSEIISVQTIEPGDGVGYGGAFVADKPMKIGTVACGYADGYPRHAGTGTPIAVAGQRTRTLGRVSMDMLACDLTDIPQADIGSPVTLWGQGLGGDVEVDVVAKAAGTISYELFCALAPRVPVF